MRALRLRLPFFGLSENPFLDNRIMKCRVKPEPGIFKGQFIGLRLMGISGAPSFIPGIREEHYRS